MRMLFLHLRKPVVIIVALIVLLFVSLLSWLYIFDTYEVKYRCNFEKGNQLSIIGIPLNAFGKEVPFRLVKSNYRIIEPNESVKIKLVEKDKAIIYWGEKKHPVQIKIGARNSMSRWENIITIPIKISEEK
jgi:hypothetical protein